MTNHVVANLPELHLQMSIPSAREPAIECNNIFELLSLDAVTTMCIVGTASRLYSALEYR